MPHVSTTCHSKLTFMYSPKCCPSESLKAIYNTLLNRDTLQSQPSP